MIKRLAATAARVHFGEVMREVVETGQAVVVERNGAPQLVMLPIAEYERLKAAAGEMTEENLHARIAAHRARILARREGVPLPSSVEIIQAMRDERMAQIESNLGHR